tara:strand:+ start:1289 stop:2236 length:948 start_codon:yes stop_codon:yes gene_type:complete
MARKARDFKGLTQAQKRNLETPLSDNNLAYSGINCGSLIEAVPQFDRADCEVILNNENNSWIVLGRDRPADITSGYGGRGNTQAASVDIVVGRMAGARSGPESDRIVAPNMFTDAARVYISQKTDVDVNFGLVGDAAVEERSAVAMKADAVRIIGREGIKLVTGKAKGVTGTGQGGEKNSQGGEIETIAGIELIAGNDVETEELEPIVKAYALAEALEVIMKQVSDLTDIVNELAKTQSKINNAVTTHTHTFAGPGKVLVSEQLAPFIPGQEAYRMSAVHQNIYKLKIKSGVSMPETRFKPTGTRWFGSRFNKTN